MDETDRERVGYSKRIEAPAFEAYLKSSRRWSLLFALMLAAVTVAGFHVYGLTSSEMDTPQALGIGFGIGSLFVLIAVLQIVSRNASTTWDGEVIDRRVERRRKGKRRDAHGYDVELLLFMVVIRADGGRIHEIISQGDDTLYKYYRIGDRVRHHGRLNTFEKFDKSQDGMVFCNACATLHAIEEDVCHRCNCPLLK